MSLILEEHRGYLRSEQRMRLYERAIREVVRPGDVVLDLACGTGILGFLALRAGARHVYGIEAGEVIEAARAVAEQNGFADRTTYIRGFSTHVELPEPADVLIADQVGYIGINAGLAEYFFDARKRLMRPEARMVPQRVTPYLAPMEAAELWEETVGEWGKPVAGVDLSAVTPFAVHALHRNRLPGAERLGEGAPLFTVDLTGPETQMWKGSHVWRAEREGTLHGFGGWFRCELAPGIEMTNEPGAADRIERLNNFFPLERPVAVEAGDEISLTFLARPGESVYRWVGQVRRDGVVTAKWQHSTWQGLYMTREDLTLTSGKGPMQLSAAGRAMLLTLQMCEAGETAQSIRARLRAEFPALATDEAAAQTLLRQAVSGALDYGTARRR